MCRSCWKSKCANAYCRLPGSHRLTNLVRTRTGSLSQCSRLLQRPPDFLVEQSVNHRHQRVLQIIENGNLTNSTKGWISSPYGEIKSGHYCVTLLVPANKTFWQFHLPPNRLHIPETKNNVHNLNLRSPSRLLVSNGLLDTTDKLSIVVLVERLRLL